MTARAVDPFEVFLTELQSPGRYRRVIRRGRLEKPLMAEPDSRVPAGTEAVADVTLEPFDGGVSVVGTVSALWQGECRRCLASLDSPVVAEVRELFRQGGGEDEGTYAMAEDRLNLREMVLDALFAALPLLPLCRPDCLGICPVCGADRNHEPCQCGPVEADPRWSALRQLKQND